MTLHHFCYIFLALIILVQGYYLRRLIKARDEWEELYNGIRDCYDQSRLTAIHNRYLWLSAIAKLWESRALQRDTTASQDVKAATNAIWWQQAADKVQAELDSEGYDWNGTKGLEL